jgi:RNA polymerase sigma-70 factor (sigma-E family)
MRQGGCGQNRAWASVKREHEAAFEEFVAGSGPRLLGLAFLLTGDRGHAEDLLQVALERTARRWAGLHGAPEAFTRTVIANLATDRWRRRRARAVEVYLDPPATLSGGTLGGDLAEAVALRTALAAAIRALPPRQRAVVVLRYFEDLTESETAAVLGVSVGTVKSTTSRALLRLRQAAHLTDDYADPPPRRSTPTPGAAKP